MPKKLKDAEIESAEEEMEEVENETADQEGDAADPEFGHDDDEQAADIPGQVIGTHGYLEQLIEECDDLEVKAKLFAMKPNVKHGDTISTLIKKASRHRGEAEYHKNRAKAESKAADECMEEVEEILSRMRDTSTLFSYAERETEFLAAAKRLAKKAPAVHTLLFTKDIAEYSATVRDATIEDLKAAIEFAPKDKDLGHIDPARITDIKNTLADRQGQKRAFKASALPDDTIEVLRDGLSIEGQNVRITRQLDTDLHKRVVAVLATIGGTWNKKAKAHVFNENPAEIIREVIEVGLMPDANPDAFFTTPADIANRVKEIVLGHIEAGSVEEIHLLEPSAGTGDLIAPILHALDERERNYEALLFELNENRANECANNLGHQVLAIDFLSHPCSGFCPNVIVTNPPFSTAQDRKAWVAHLQHALDILEPGGMLVAILPASILFRSDKDIVALREQFAIEGASIEELPDGAFSASGTNVRTVIAKLVKPEAAEVVDMHNGDEESNAAAQ